MGHLAAERARTLVTPREWLKVGSQIGELCNTWSGRGDVVAYVGEGAGKMLGAPVAACWIPVLAEMEVDVEQAFLGARPEHIDDMRDRETHFEYPVAAGAILHEAYHAKKTRYNLADLMMAPEPRAVRVVAENIEETRIEAAAVRDMPENRSFLRACALKLVMGDMDLEKLAEQGVFGISTVMLLTLARVDAGVLDPDDVAEIRELCVGVFGEDLMRGLRDIWRRGQAWASDEDCSEHLRLGHEWVKLLQESGLMDEEQAKAGMPSPGGGDPGDGDGEGQEIPEEFKRLLEQLAEAIEEAAESAEIQAREEGARQQLDEFAKRVAEQRGQVAKEQRQDKEEAAKVFSRNSGPATADRTDSKLQKKRPPEDEERAAAVRLARMLERAQYRDMTRTLVSSEMPPGRLDTAVAMQASAERAVNGMTVQEPWWYEHREHVEDPILKLGVGVDISGSMSGAMEAMAVTAWVFSEAARRIQAQCAMVYYGQSIFPVLKPGQHLDEVNIYTAPDSTEEAVKAIKALTGALDLKHGTGPRLLVLCSDTCYRYDVAAGAAKLVEQLVKHGCAVVILTFDDNKRTAASYRAVGAKVINSSMGPAQAAMEIGQACVEAIEAAARNVVS